MPDLVASFQNAVVDALVSRTVAAAKEYGYDKVAIAGGVASNSALRAEMKKACRKAHLSFYHPSPIFCTDNAAMIGVAAYYEYQKGARAGWELNAVPHLKLGERCGERGVNGDGGEDRAKGGGYGAGGWPGQAHEEQGPETVYGVGGEASDRLRSAAL